MILGRAPANSVVSIEFGGKQSGYYLKNCISAWSLCNQKDVGMYYVISGSN